MQKAFHYYKVTTEEAKNVKGIMFVARSGFPLEKRLISPLEQLMGEDLGWLLCFFFSVITKMLDLGVWF